MEFFTSVLGSKLADAKYESGAISRRASMGYQVSGDATFNEIAVKAEKISTLLSSALGVTDSQLPSMIHSLKTLRADLDILEASLGLREEISAACQARTLGQSMPSVNQVAKAIPVYHAG